MTETLILHHYDTSPFSEKVRVARSSTPIKSPPFASAPKLRPNYLVDATAATVDARRAGNREATWKNPPPMRRLPQRPQRGG
jgi:hypothetical protein